MLLFPICVVQYADVPFVICFQYILIFLKIVIEGIRGQSYQGDIAIDDLWIDDSPCPPEGHFTFYFCIIIFQAYSQKNTELMFLTVGLTIIL